jgi:hypothetical protein
MKYIIFEYQHPVIFPVVMAHNETAALLRHLGRPTSAGFIRLDDIGTGMKLYPYGSSISLNLESEPGDSDIINKTLKQ